MTEETAKIDSFALSHQGKYREDNQDSIRVCDSSEAAAVTHGHLYAVANGMGGYSHGGVASALALETFCSTVFSSNPSNLPNAMKRAINDANLAVYQQAHRMGVARMGTTLTAVIIVGNKMHIAHIGDSRAYLIRNGSASLLTNDHTSVGELVRMKVLSPSKVRTHARRSELNKCLGVELFVSPDISTVPIMPGDVLILCSDGVWSMIEDNEFAELTARNSNLEALSHAVLEMAMDRDSDDNVSVVTIHAEQLAAHAPDTSSNSGWKIPGLFRNRITNRS